MNSGRVCTRRYVVVLRKRSLDPLGIQIDRHILAHSLLLMYSLIAVKTCLRPSMIGLLKLIIVKRSGILVVTSTSWYIYLLPIPGVQKSTSKMKAISFDSKNTYWLLLLIVSKHEYESSFHWSMCYKNSSQSSNKAKSIPRVGASHKIGALLLVLLVVSCHK